MKLLAILILLVGTIAILRAQELDQEKAPKLLDLLSDMTARNSAPTKRRLLIRCGPLGKLCIGRDHKRHLVDSRPRYALSMEEPAVDTLGASLDTAQLRKRVLTLLAEQIMEEKRTEEAAVAEDTCIAVDDLDCKSDNDCCEDKDGFKKCQKFDFWSYCVSKSEFDLFNWASSSDSTQDNSSEEEEEETAAPTCVAVDDSGCDKTDKVCCNGEKYCITFKKGQSDEYNKCVSEIVYGWLNF